MDECKSDSIAIEVSEDCVFKHLGLVDRYVTGVYTRTLAPFGLTPSQLCFLVVLQRTGPAGEVSPGLLAQILGMEKSTVSRNLKRMANRGLVSFVKTEKGYVSEISITQKGVNLIEETYDAWKAAQDLVRTELGASFVKDLKSIADRQPDTTDENVG